MLKKVYRIISTVIFKLYYSTKIDVKGFLNLNGDTKLSIKSGGHISLGKGVLTYHNVHFSAVGGNLVIGDRVSFNRNCIVICRDSIKIGERCIFGPNVCIYDHDHKYGVDGIENGYKTSKIVIGSGCWIGANVIILRGSSIGDGCVIGAGTIVKGNIPEKSIVTNERGLKIQRIY